MKIHLACNLNSKSMNHPAPTDHRPWLGMTQLIKFNRESVCDSKIFKFEEFNLLSTHPTN